MGALPNPPTPQWNLPTLFYPVQLWEKWHAPIPISVGLYNIETHSGLTQNTKTNNSCMGESQYIQPLMLPQTQTIAPPILPQWIHTSLHMTARPAVSERLGQTIQTSRVETQIQTTVFLDGPESSWTPVLWTLKHPSMNAECQTN